jgi:hypothetical protein
LDCAAVSDEGVQSLAALTALTKLHLVCTVVGDEGVTASLPDLSFIDLYNTRRVGDAGVRALASFPTLNSLIISQEYVSDESRAVLACCRIAHVEYFLDREQGLASAGAASRRCRGCGMASDKLGPSPPGDPAYVAHVLRTVAQRGEPTRERSEEKGIGTYSSSDGDGY